MRDLEHVGQAVQKQPPRGVLWKKMFLKISQNSQQNTCARVPFLINFPASGLQLYQKKKKKKDWQSCFLTNFVKFLRLSFLQTTSGRLSLAVVSAASFTGVINSNVMFSSNILLIYWLLSDKIKHFRSTFPLYT